MTTPDESVSLSRPAVLGAGAALLGALAAAALAPLRASAAEAPAGAVTVIATVKAKPGMESMLHDVFLGLVAPARADASNISYDLVVSIADPTTFVSIERWKSAAALQAHLGTPPVLDAISKLGPIVAGPPDIASYTAVSSPA